MNPFATALPQIPGCLLHTMYELRVSGGYSKGQGGQFVPTPEARVPFEGAVLPVSDKDLQRSPQGTFSARSEKIYTNGHSLQEGGQQPVWTRQSARQLLLPAPSYNDCLSRAAPPRMRCVP